MASTKRVFGDYTIQTVNPTDKININSSLVTINGNLVVIGNTATVQSTVTSVYDNFFELLGNLTTSTSPTLNAGIIVNRGNSANVYIQWNETYKVWQTYNGTTLANIAAVTGIGYLANIYQDTAPAISANLDLRGQRIWNSNIASPLVGNVSLYIGNVGTGGTGIYANNTSYSNAEIINKTRSVAYSLLFG
jgi:hypothetical protein